MVACQSAGAKAGVSQHRNSHAAANRIISIHPSPPANTPIGAVTGRSVRSIAPQAIAHDGLGLVLYPAAKPHAKTDCDNVGKPFPNRGISRFGNQAVASQRGFFDF